MPKTQVVESLRQKVGQLISDNRKIRSEADKLSAQRDRLREENRSLTEKIAALEKKIGILELREGFSGTAQDNRVAAARINRLMREVDKCIAMLNH